MSKNTIPYFQYVKEILTRETGIPISLKNYYKFPVLFPLLLKHYFGITQSNELIARGIEIRRHDAPNFIKQFQTELLYTLFDCKESAEVISKGYRILLCNNILRFRLEYSGQGLKEGTSNSSRP